MMNYEVRNRDGYVVTTIEAESDREAPWAAALKGFPAPDFRTARTGSVKMLLTELMEPNSGRTGSILTESRKDTTMTTNLSESQLRRRTVDLSERLRQLEAKEEAVTESALYMAGLRQGLSPNGAASFALGRLATPGDAAVLQAGLTSAPADLTESERSEMRTLRSQLREASRQLREAERARQARTARENDLSEAALIAEYQKAGFSEQAARLMVKG